jgi:tetrahydromethanopterin S-methyltransferase subunit G
VGRLLKSKPSTHNITPREQLMTEDQANRIIEKLEDLDNRLDYLSRMSMNLDSSNRYLKSISWQIGSVGFGLAILLFQLLIQLMSLNDQVMSLSNLI